MVKVKSRPSGRTFKARTKVVAEEEPWEYCDQIRGEATMLRTRYGSDA